VSGRETVIEARGICNRFGSQSVHENLDLDLYRGEILAVVGGSGSGKSVLLRSIIGLRRPNEGQIKVFGQDLAELREEQRSLVERRFGVLFQKGALFSSLTITENVALPLIEHAGLSRADAEHLAGVKLALAGLPISAADKYPASLSGGMIKRAALARALALDPDILFLDEPTAGLDPIGAAAFDQLILTLRDALASRCSSSPTTWTPSTPSPTASRCCRRRKCWWPALWPRSSKPTTPGFKTTFTAPAGVQPNRPPPARGRSAERWKPEHIMSSLAWSPSWWWPVPCCSACG